MNYYISDLHIGHANVIRYDHRPFSDLNEMHETIITNWNRAVTPSNAHFLKSARACWWQCPQSPWSIALRCGCKVSI